MNRAANALLGGIVALALAAGVVLMMGDRPSKRETERGREFQELVGGLGFGPALDLSRCAFSFDPRLCSACSHDEGEVPGGKAFCPHHVGAVIDYRSPGGDE